jgi:hypothetical protein
MKMRQLTHLKRLSAGNNVSYDETLLINRDASGGLTHVYVTIFAVHDAELLKAGKSWECNRLTTQDACHKHKGVQPGNSRLPGSFTSTFPFCF